MDPEEIYIRDFFQIPTDDLDLKYCTVSLDNVLKMLQDYESKRTAADNK